jgi:hypothetical protein
MAAVPAAQVDAGSSGLDDDLAVGAVAALQVFHFFT